MALTNAERQKKYRERLKTKTLRNDNVTDGVTECNDVTRNVIQDDITLRNDNITHNITLRIDKLEKLIVDNNGLLSAMLEKIKNIEMEQVLLRNAVTQNIKEAVTQDVTDSDVTSNEKSVASNLIFDLEKAKAIAAGLRGLGITANEISTELASQGYGNMRGKPFSKSSINKWFQQRS